MPQSYQDGAYMWTAEEFTLDTDFVALTSTEVGPDEFSTVEVIDVEKGSGVRVGQGQSSNLLQAEGSVRGDIQNGGNSDIDGRYRLVVLNEQNNVVEGGIVTQGTIDAVEVTRSGNIDGDVTPVQPQQIKEPYKLGLQLKTNSGTETYSSSNSNLTIDGYRAEKLR